MIITNWNFSNKVKEDYLLALETKEIDEALFNKYSLDKLHEIVKSPNDYCLKIIQYNQNRKRDLEIIDSYKKIILYGAGAYGQNMFRRIKSI